MKYRTLIGMYSDKTLSDLTAERTKLESRQIAILQQCIDLLKNSGVKGWKDEYQDLETKLRSREIYTKISNRPHKGLRLLGSTKRGILSQVTSLMSEYDSNVDVLNAIGVSIGELKNPLPDAVAANNQSANNQGILILVLVLILVYLIFRKL